jgi:hypothetical protein
MSVGIYEVESSSGGLTFIPYFVKIGPLVQKFKGQNGDSVVML